jgi:hypothetical protein
VVLAIPAGGVPIGKEVALSLGAQLSLAVVRKIRIPGTTESGFGAVTWDGQVLINEGLRAALGLTSAEVDRAVGETKKNVNERIVRFGEKLEMEGKTVILPMIRLPVHHAGCNEKHPHSPSFCNQQFLQRRQNRPLVARMQDQLVRSTYGLVGDSRWQKRMKVV